MPQTSAGILLHRRRAGVLEVLLVHFGGPFWTNKDVGAWSMPKGLIEPGEDPEQTARREFEEELGSKPEGTPRYLCRIRQRGGKWVEAFSLEGDLDADRIVSNHYTQEWPPKSGRVRSFPEVDRARWFTVAEARDMMLPSQLPILDALLAQLGGHEGG